MMQNNEMNNSFELPPVQTDVGSEQADAVDSPVRSPEVSVAPRQSTLPSTADSSAIAQSNAMPAGSAGALMSDDNSSTSNPIVADDNDLIEKEWVIKAKQIVAATRDDPYKQSYEISKFKADYLKKRYGKDIKVEER